ncbi:(2Fe-2S)-binding protein [Acetobacter indonesiensis]|uniref:(2Fe-2S)-binding protein n=1 Tax=Acetobacter indonesiensis TaxID=104101 RepID=UPI001F1997D4|nr:(2Fe-2S)-binding protein [Acetobacter indonesiensis]MCG0995845.1 (2Fe-2S)-binding protein [Acetobacter indonesiensis]
MDFELKINGVTHSVAVQPDMPLLWILRDILGLTGTKYGCGVAQCGACTVHMDGNPVRSCLLTVTDAAGHDITTIEAIEHTEIGSKVQQAWLDEEVIQCGYCQSGQIMAATALLQKIAHPTNEEIDNAMAGNICRCGTYVRIRKAIHRASSHDN